MSTPDGLQRGPQPLEIQLSGRVAGGPVGLGRPRRAVLVELIAHLAELLLLDVAHHSRHDVALRGCAAWGVLQRSGHERRDHLLQVELRLGLKAGDEGGLGSLET